MNSNSMIKRATTFVFFLFVTANVVFAQDEAIKHSPSVTVGISALKFTGDVGKQTDVNPLLDTRFGYYIAVEQRFGKVFGVSLGGLYGKLAGTDNSVNSHLNFQSTIMQGELLLTANFDKLMKYDPSVSPFLNVGIGFMKFDPKGDLKNGNVAYNYWSDGSIRDLPESPANQVFANVIKRDYTYETQLKDSLNSYSRSCLTVPVGGGLNFHMGKRWTSSIGVNYVLCLSDFVDNRKSGGNDSYLQASFGLQYEFKKKIKSASDGVDFNEVDHVDADGDGVGDDKDRCLGTPKGVLVDSHGCPYDTDGDGVPDYMDKEPKSKKDAKVDGFGVTINEDEMARHQLEWDSLAVERSEKFNEAPSLEYLKQMENKEKKELVDDNRANKIPDDLKSADLDNNGFISAEEITKTIDSFFEGINDFTVEKINRLIDFFFEQ